MMGANFARRFGFGTPPFAPPAGSGDQPMGMPPMEGVPQAAPTPFKLTTSDKLGLFGDALTGRPIFSPMVNDRRQQAQQQEAERRRAATAFDQWRMQKDYERANPAPRFFEANNGDQYKIGADGQPERLFQDPTPKVTMTPIKNQDGTTTLYPTVNGQVVAPGASAAPAAGAPNLPQGFTVRPKGGAAAKADAPFPVRPLTR